MATSFSAFSANGDEEEPVIISSSSAPHPFDDDEDDSYFHVETAADHVPSSPDMFGLRSDPLPDFGSEANGDVFVSGEPVLPPPSEMQPDEGFVLREWRRQNAMLLEDKEKKEKELREQIIVEAQQYKEAFYEKRKLNVETSKVQNREKEKVFITNQEKFHADADKHYWKAISELIPHEIANIEKKRGKKEKENKPSITVMKGPKPGKPTDMSRMRHILVKLKHTPPPHMNLPEPVKEPAKETGSSTGKVTVPVSA